MGELGPLITTVIHQTPHIALISIHCSLFDASIVPCTSLLAFPVKTLCVQEVSLGGFWAVGGAALDLGGDLGVSRVSPAESQLPGPLGQRGGTVSTGSQEVAPQAGVSLTVMGKSDCGRG